MLLPLYPQFSTTTTASSFNAWKKASNVKAPTVEIESYPTEPGFIRASIELVKQGLAEAGDGPKRVLFSAHGLPEKIIKAGDPYQAQVEQTAAAIGQQLDGRVVGLLPEPGGSAEMDRSADRGRNPTRRRRARRALCSIRSASCPNIPRRWSSSISIIGISPSRPACRNMSGCRPSARIHSSSTVWLSWFGQRYGLRNLKALHIVAAISWMAGLLYLPRLFVYHADTRPDRRKARLSR